MTPKIIIEKFIIPDHKTKKPYIKVVNKSFWKWNTAYDLHFFLLYYKDKKPIHTGFIHDGVMKVNKDDNAVKYSITPKKKIDYDAYSPNCELEVSIICRNKLGTYSFFEEKCVVDDSVVKGNTE